MIPLFIIIQQTGQDTQSILVFDHSFPTATLTAGAKFLGLWDCGIHVSCKKTAL